MNHSSNLQPWGLTVLRVVVGAVFLMHVCQKLFVFGFHGVAGFLGPLRVPAPAVFAVVLTLVEFVGGALLILGLFTRWAAWLLAAGGLRPPRLRELAPALGVELEPLARFLRRAERVGRIAPVAANRVFLPDTLARLAEIARELAEHSADGSFAAADFKERSGIGRNLTIEVLEYLDSIGITRRVGDTRIVLRAGD